MFSEPTTRIGCWCSSSILMTPPTILIQRCFYFLHSHFERALGFAGCVNNILISADRLPFLAVCLMRRAWGLLDFWAFNSLFLKHWTLLSCLLVRPPGHHWPSCQTYSFSSPSQLAYFWSYSRFPSWLWTPLFFMRRSMLSGWWFKRSWIDQRLVLDCLNSEYWLLHSR
jgi:hypothetical protein